MLLDLSSYVVSQSGRYIGIMEGVAGASLLVRWITDVTLGRLAPVVGQALAWWLGLRRIDDTRDEGIGNNRAKFSEEEHQGSALAQHCWEAHREHFSLDIFKLGLIKSVSPLSLDRHESKLIDRFRTKLFGLNRINVVR